MAIEAVQPIAGVASGRGCDDAAIMMSATVARPGRGRIVAAVLAAGLLLAACSSSSTSSPSSSPSTSATPAATSAAAPATASPASAVCQAAAGLRASVDTLTHVKIGKGTADEIKSGLADVKAKLTALTAELHGQFTAQTSGVKSALDTLKTAVSDLTAHPSISTVKGAATAVSGVAAAASSLLGSLAPQCGSASASPSP
jgi:putative hemolysin